MKPFSKVPFTQEKEKKRVVGAGRSMVKVLNVRTRSHTGGCTDAERQPALKVDSGRKIPCRTWDSKLHQYCIAPGFLDSTIMDWAIPALRWKTGKQWLIWLCEENCIQVVCFPSLQNVGTRSHPCQVFLKQNPIHYQRSCEQDQIHDR